MACCALQYSKCSILVRDSEHNLFVCIWIKGNNITYAETEAQNLLTLSEQSQNKDKESTEFTWISLSIIRKSFFYFNWSVSRKSINIWLL